MIPQPDMDTVLGAKPEVRFTGPEGTAFEPHVTETLQNYLDEHIRKIWQAQETKARVGWNLSALMNQNEPLIPVIEDIESTTLDHVRAALAVAADSKRNRSRPAPEFLTCPNCRGDGSDQHGDCPECDGEGSVPAKRQPVTPPGLVEQLRGLLDDFDADPMQRAYWQPVIDTTIELLATDTET